eukprot:tig00021517_g22015.t1
MERPIIDPRSGSASSSGSAAGRDDAGWPAVSSEALQASASGAKRFNQIIRAAPFPVVVAHGKLKRIGGTIGPFEVQRSRDPKLDYPLISFKCGAHHPRPGPPAAGRLVTRIRIGPRRQYRLAVPSTEQGGDPSLLGCLLRVRLLFADTGEVAAFESPGSGARQAESEFALAGYPPGSKRAGVPCPELFLRVNDAGYTEDRFGCRTTSFLVSWRPLLLEVSVAGSGRPVASFLIEVLSHKTWAALHSGAVTLKRARPSTYTGAGRAPLRPLKKTGSSPSPSGAPPGPAGVTSPVPLYFRPLQLRAGRAVSASED